MIPFILLLFHGPLRLGTGQRCSCNSYTGSLSIPPPPPQTMSVDLTALINVLLLLPTEMTCHGTYQLGNTGFRQMWHLKWFKRASQTDVHALWSASKVTLQETSTRKKHYCMQSWWIWSAPAMGCTKNCVSVHRWNNTFLSTLKCFVQSCLPLIMTPAWLRISIYQEDFCHIKWMVRPALERK